MAHSSPHNDPNDSLARRHETSDVHVKSVLLSGFGFVGIMVLGLLISWGVYALFNHDTAAPGSHAETFAEPNPNTLPPGPNLQSDPHAALVAMRHGEDSVLTTYAWVSRDSGIVRVPVSRAMQLLVKRGVAFRQPRTSQ
jgi:hypothetical protein